MLAEVLSEGGKSCSIVDDVSVVKRYACGASNAISVYSDHEALLKAKKEVC